MGREGLKKELKKKRFSREFKSQRYRLKKIYHTKTLSRPFNKQHENKFHRIQPVPRNKSHHPPGCRCEWASPNLRIGAATPASHRCRLQRVPKNYSPSNRRGCTVLHDSSTLPSFRERMKNKERRLLFEATCVTMEDRRRRCIHSHLPQGWPRSYARPGNSLCRNVKRVERVTKDSGVNESLKRETRGWHT